MSDRDTSVGPAPREERVAVAGPGCPPRRPVSRGKKIALAVLTILAWAPLVSAVLASAVAGAFGCVLNEASANPCIVAGHDVGEALVVMFLMAWVAIFVLPLTLATLVGWLVVWSRRARPA